MSLELIHLTVAIFFTLGIDAYAISKYFKWNIRKACAVSLLINFVSMIAAFMAQQYLITKLPAEWFFLHHISNQYASVFLTFFSVTIIVKILFEFLVLSFFDKEVPNSLLWSVIIVMNLITALPGSVYDFVRGKPEINKPFSIIKNADWIKNSEDKIYFLNAKNKMLTVATPGTDEYYPLTSAQPFFGYRISDNGNAIITLGRTNVVTISVVVSNSLSENFIYPSDVENVDLIDVVPGENIFAFCISNQLKCFDLQTGALTGKVIVLPQESYDNISIGKKISEIICCTKTNKLSANWIAGTVKYISNDKNVQTYPSYVCSIQNYVALTNSFHSPKSDINVVMNKGLNIYYNGETNEFNVGTIAKYIGIGFLSDEENFMFQLGGEIMVVNIKTKKTGHLYEGVLGIIKNNRYLIE
ncbi:hypothetical protein KAH27_08810 [bacterium]|nr:hypothetical protein [bacterium]